MKGTSVFLSTVIDRAAAVSGEPNPLREFLYDVLERGGRGAVERAGGDGRGHGGTSEGAWPTVTFGGTGR